MAKNGIIQVDDKKRELILNLIEFGTITAACKASKISRQTFYNYLNNDPSFSDEVDHARESVTDDLEQEAIRRAKDGSDTLLIFLLKGNRPEKYKEYRNIELSGKGGGPVELTNVPTAELLARAHKLLGDIV